MNIGRMRARMKVNAEIALLPIEHTGSIRDLRFESSSFLWRGRSASVASRPYAPGAYRATALGCHSLQGILLFTKRP